MRPTLRPFLLAVLGFHAAVFNLGARGIDPQANLLTLHHLRCRQGDIVILQGVDPRTLATLAAESPAAAAACALPDFTRRAPGEELFLDGGHVGPRGHELLAGQIVERLLAFPSSAQGPVFPITPREREEDSAGFGSFLARIDQARVDARPCGAIVLNANPFTLGHRHLVEHAASRVAHLHLFVVEEDRSEFPFATRFAMVQEGSRHLPNVSVLPSGRFMMSAATCPAYFTKEDRPDVEIDASVDLGLFAEHVAPRLGITVRFVGREPNCPITRQHNAQMRTILPPLGIRVEEIPRLEIAGVPVSASVVRRAIRAGDVATARRLVPPTTLPSLLAGRP